MVKHYFIVVLCLLAIGLSSCWSSSVKQESSREEPSKKEGLVVINVLDKQLYDDCHIAGSINVTIDQLATFIESINKEKAEIIVYCSNYQCTASDFVGKKLTVAGCKNVSVYKGGAAEWYQQKLPVQGVCKSAYLTKVIAQPERGTEHQGLRIITAQELAQKMKH